LFLLDQNQAGHSIMGCSAAGNRGLLLLEMTMCRLVRMLNIEPYAMEWNNAGETPHLNTVSMVMPGT
jgi:hypothetical protein